MIDFKFTNIVNNYWPARPIRITVGDTETYMGVNSRGLEHMREEQIKYLDSHEPMHMWCSKDEIHLVYRKSKKYNKIVWGE